MASGCQDLPRISALRMPGAARQNRLARGKTRRRQTIPTRSVATGKGSEGGDAGRKTKDKTHEQKTSRLRRSEEAAETTQTLTD